MSRPIQISPRLLPAVEIGDSWLSYDKTLFYLDTTEGEHEISGFRFQGTTTVGEALSTCLSFMMAAAEAQDAVDAGRFSDNANIFPLDIMRWCQENVSEIGYVQYELEDYK